MATVLPIQRSDHSPIVVDTHWNDRGNVFKGKTRFEEAWLYHNDAKQIIQRAWSNLQQGSKLYQIVQKQNFMVRHLKNLSNLSINKIQLDIQQIKSKLEKWQCRSHTIQYKKQLRI